jgi:hypothetical protein
MKLSLERRVSRGLLVLFCLILTGFDGFDCSSDDDSDSGSTGTDIRVENEQKISANSGNFDGNLDPGDRFGSALANLGDLESDGVTDLAVGTPFNDDGGTNRGAVWVLFMDDTGEVDTEQKISHTTGGFNRDLDDGDEFGSALAAIGDLDNDNVFDLAVGVPGDDRGGTDRGGLWILFLDIDGTVLDSQKIADDTGGFNGNLDDDDRFGSAIAEIGDLDGDGVTDLAVGAPMADDGVNDAGAVWILFMNTDGTVDSSEKISRISGGFDGTIRADDHFGAALAGIGDLNNDGIPDLAVGAPGYDRRGSERGAVWVLFLNSDGSVLAEQLIADREGDFEGRLRNDDRFGSALANVRDLNNDGVPDIAAGAPNDDDGADNAGAVWILLMTVDGTVDGWQKVSRSAGELNANLDADDNFGAAIAGMGNLDNNNIDDIAVGTPGNDDGGEDQGAVWMLFMEITSQQTP